MVVSFVGCESRGFIFEASELTDEAHKERFVFRVEGFDERSSTFAVGDAPTANTKESIGNLEALFAVVTNNFEWCKASFEFVDEVASRWAETPVLQGRGVVTLEALNTDCEAVFALV